MILPSSHVKIVIFSIIAIAVICSSMAIANIAHAGKTELPVVLSHDVRLVLYCIVPGRQSGIVTNHQPSAKIQYFDQYFYSSTAISEQNVASYVYMNVCFSSFGWASCFGKCISKRWLYCNDKIDCSVKSLYYLIINHCTGLNWSDWRFKRSLKLLFTDDQLHTSLTDEILMKNWPKSNNATDPGVIYLKLSAFHSGPV